MISRRGDAARAHGHDGLDRHHRRDHGGDNHHAGASDRHASHNGEPTSHDRANDRHPSSAHNHRDRRFAASPPGAG
ncbi:hypothetical protein BF23_12375 [Klebsiella variicola]|nr:hypothetical protein BF23_12375 [Klebsiella variicola]